MSTHAIELVYWLQSATQFREWPLNHHFLHFTESGLGAERVYRSKTPATIALLPESRALSSPQVVTHPVRTRLEGYPIAGAYRNLVAQGRSG